jgi:D-tyrosyl-tRNA(Tyr) deacylase
VRTVVQRVSEASVEVDGAVVGTIGLGLVVLVGVAPEDTRADVEALATKLAGLRVFPDEEGRMNRSLTDAGGSVLVVSQFTLYGSVRRGRRPSFDGAAPPEVAAPLVDQLAGQLRTLGVPTQTGLFGQRMTVRLVNQGPVTLLIESVGGVIT